MLPISYAQELPYRVVWTPELQHVERSFPVWPILVAMCVVVIVVHRRKPLVAALYLTFVLMVGLVMMWMESGWNSGVATAYKRTALAADDPTTPVVQGRVRNFHPQPAEGGQNETFDVDSVAFSYSYHEVTGGFNRSQSHGGPIREGLQVRIHYLPDSHWIVKLEVADSVQRVP